MQSLPTQTKTAKDIGLTELYWIVSLNSRFPILEANNPNLSESKQSVNKEIMTTNTVSSISSVPVHTATLPSDVQRFAAAVRSQLSLVP
jgi:hypothetical protein